MNKLIYNFDDVLVNKHADLKNLLGNKGYNLSEMANDKLPIPPGFTITTDLCKYYYSKNHTMPDSLLPELKSCLKNLEKITSKQFGSSSRPLLVSVRSGSPVSMPGMMDTILNLGMNDKVVDAIAKQTNNEAFAYDCYARFVKSFANIALEVPHTYLSEMPKNTEDEHLAMLKVSISSDIEKLKKIGKILPEDPFEQLQIAIEAVIKSWNCPRAKIYRKIQNINDSIGTAVTIQSMVFGNFNSNSGTGVIFSRNPATGSNELYGEYIENAQGEDIVSGKHTPIPINDHPSSLQAKLPSVYSELENYCMYLEKKYKDVQDVEFTVESGKLYILQARSAKRTATASFKFLCDFVEEGLISKEEAILAIESDKLDQIIHPTISPNEEKLPFAYGLAASPGAAVGQVVFSSDAAENYAKNFDVILFRNDTCPEDIKGMSVSQAIVTSKGGLTSHAAVVARGIGKPCICGMSDLNIDFQNNLATLNGHIIREFDLVSVDGSTGAIYIGEVEISPATKSKELEQILSWANEYKKLSVRANAETPHDVAASLEFGAEGIGLCRTEHMFFAPEKISLVRQMIICTSLDSRNEILDKILPLHRNDFLEIFRLLNGLPLNVRLLDPPLHEFLPKEDAEIKALSSEMELDINVIKYQIDRLSEANPMLGHRGARLGVTHPEIYRMQINAIITAAAKTLKSGVPVSLEIMLPLISNFAELIYLKEIITEEALIAMKNAGMRVEYKLGTMIELPRAAFIADQIAEHVDFFSFGTNDLTQTIYGISRDDSAHFMPEYKALGIFQADPFATIDQESVGEVIKISIEKSKRSKKKISYGICGEHGGDPVSIEFFHKAGLDYVSCSPYRIIAAKIAAAKAKLRFK